MWVVTCDMLHETLQKYFEFYSDLRLRFAFQLLFTKLFEDNLREYLKDQREYFVINIRIINYIHIKFNKNIFAKLN